MGMFEHGRRKGRVAQPTQGAGPEALSTVIFGLPFLIGWLRVRNSRTRDSSLEATPQARRTSSKTALYPHSLITQTLRGQEPHRARRVAVPSPTLRGPYKCASPSPHKTVKGFVDITITLPYVFSTNPSSVPCAIASFSVERNKKEFSALERCWS